jgi:copper chaperone CopZ
MMKKILLSGALMLAAVVGQAKNIKTLVVTTQPQMHCASCEKKIKGNLRFEKGVKSIDCNISDQRVTITYDAEKTNGESIVKSFGKFGYKATEVKNEEKKPEMAPQNSKK